MPGSEKNKEVVRRLARAINSGNLDDLDRVLAPNYIRHDPNPLLKDADREEYKRAFTRLRNAFPDASWTILELLNDGDRVIGRWTFRGTQKARSLRFRRAARRSRIPYWSSTA